MDRPIKLYDHGVYGVDPERIPCCPVCDQPMWKGEDLALQECDVGPGQQDMVRLTHLSCVSGDEDDDEED